MAIQQFLISKILQPLQQLTANWSDKTKDRVFVWSGLLIILQSFLQGMGVSTYRFLIFFAVDCVFLGGMLLSSLSENMKPVRFRKFPAFCWFGIGFLMLLAGFIVTDNRLPEAMLFLVALPICFIVWNNTDRERIFSLLSRTCILSFIPYTLINTLLYPMGTKQYAGLMRNVNGASFYLLLVFAFLLTELLSARKFTAKVVGYVLLLGLCVAQIYYTSSRTGYLAMLLVAITTVVLHIILHRREKQWLSLLVKGLACALSIFVCINTAFYLFQVSKFIPDEWIEMLHLPEDPLMSDELVLNLDAISDLNGDKFSILGKSLDRISTGRISIWKAFGADLNLFGNPDGKSYYIHILSRDAHSTHNTILQVAYESGIPAGILYLLFNIFSGVYSIKHARKNRKEASSLMPYAITVSFGVMAMLSSLGVSFYYIITLYYYFVQFPLIVKQEDAKTTA